jgi:cystathionine beta-lyase
MRPDFDKSINRLGTDSIKWSLYDQDVLPLWVADMDFESPASILSEIRDRTNHGVFGYSRPQEKTKVAIQDWLHQRHDWKVEKDAILIIPGVVPGFNFCAKAFTRPGDSLYFHTPAYHPFFNVAQNSKLNQLAAPLSCNNGYFSISKDQLLSTFEPSTRLFLLCNPQNPTGRVFSRAELQDIGEVCLGNNTLICSDEIHSDLVFTGHKHTPIASLSEDIASITITLISASKTFNIAGLKSSAAIITNPILREKFQDATNGFLGSVNLLGETALRAAYQKGEDWLSSLLQYLEKNRDLLLDFVDTELDSLSVTRPEGTFLAWLDCSRIGIDNPAEFFLEKGRIGLNSGDWFGKEYSKFVRLNFGCPRSTLMQALDRLKNALDYL